MLQILHFADLHLDTSFSVSHLPPEVGEWRRKDLRATLGRILTMARERKVDVVTIAGDLYDQNFALPDLADFLKQQFARLAPIRVVIAPGQYDPYTNDSLYALTDWPDNVFIFSQGKLSALEIGPGIHLWGAAHPPSRIHTELTGFRADRQDVNLLLLHAVDLEDQAEPNHNTFAVEVASIQSAGFDFALLGHQHCERLWPEEAPLCVFPGSPEPLSMAEAAGAHQVVLLNIEDNRCTPEPIPISQWRYRSLEIDLTGCETNDEAVRRISQAWQDRVEDSKYLIGQVTLTGTPDYTIDIEELTETIDTKAHLQYHAQFTMAYNLEQLAQELTVRGELVRRFQARLQNARRDQERHDMLNALHIALQALDGKQIPLLFEVAE